MTQNEQQALAHFAKKHEGKMRLTSNQAHLANWALVERGGTMQVIGYNQIEANARPIKKDGSLGKEKKLALIITHNYCPHCGEKYPTE